MTMRTPTAEANIAAAALTPILEAPLTSALTYSIGTTGAMTFDRSGTVFYPDDNGVYQSKTANIPGYNSKGIFLEAAATNRCTNYNSLSSDVTTNVSTTGGTLSTVSDVAGLAAAGLANICTTGKVFKLVNSSGSSQTVTIAGASGGVYPATISAWMRVSAKPVVMQLTGGLGALTVVPNTTFERFYSENITVAAGTEQFQFVIPDGGTVEWILNQYEDSTANAESNLTGPIIVSGAAASRVGTFLRFADTAPIIPVNNYTIYFEMSSPSEHQQNGGNVRYLQYRDGTNEELRISGTNFVKRNAALSALTTGGVCGLIQTKRPMSIAVHISDNRGTEVYINGAISTVSLTGNVVDHPVTALTMYLGSISTSGNYFTGQIRNFRIYSGKLSVPVLRALTHRYNEITNLGNRGLPVYDKNIPTRIWSLRYDSVATNYDAIEYSDDYGSSWVTWLALTTKASQGTLHMAANGSFYYFVQTSPSDKLYRVDGTTKAITAPITFYPAHVGGWSWFSWTWGEDELGYLYTAAYSLSDATGDQYFWKSIDGGATFSRVDYLVTNLPNCRHVHSLHVNPYDNSLWVTVGDDAATRGTFRSADRGVAFTQITDAVSPGPTGLTFTSEQTLTSTDTVGNTNYVRGSVSAGAFATRIMIPAPLSLAPLYYLRAAGDNEIWVTQWNESSSNQTPGAIYKWTKKIGANSVWSLEKFFPLYDVAQDGAGPYAIAHNGNGIIPSGSPYVFVQLRRATENGLPLKSAILRILRADTIMGTPITVRSQFREI